jgi:large-conductance mechanosensitive channel
MLLQNIIIFILVAVAFFYIAKRIYSNIKHDGTKEGCAKCDELREKKKVS